jgi:hypothetical protein
LPPGGRRQHPYLGFNQVELLIKSILKSTWLDSATP